MSISSRPTIILLTISLLVSRCGPSGNDSDPPGQEQAVANDLINLEGSSWQLEKITAIGGYEFVPEDGSDYILRFRRETRLVVESDCNTAGATWTQDGNTVQLRQFVTTNNLCPPGTLHNHFVSNLRNIEAFDSDGDNLVFSTSIPGVTMEFAARNSGSSQ